MATVVKAIEIIVYEPRDSTPEEHVKAKVLRCAE